MDIEGPCRGLGRSGWVGPSFFLYREGVMIAASRETGKKAKSPPLLISMVPCIFYTRIYIFIYRAVCASTRPDLMSRGKKALRFSPRLYANKLSSGTRESWRCGHKTVVLTNQPLGRALLLAPRVEASVTVHVPVWRTCSFVLPSPLAFRRSHKMLASDTLCKFTLS